MRFDDVIGAAGVPAGSAIQSATLSLELSDDFDNPLLDADFFVHRMLAAWSESSTWNSLGNGLQVGPELGPAFAVLDGDNDPNDDFLRRIDVTAAVQAWSNGEPNWGFAIMPEIVSGNDDGIEIRTSESDIAILRPRLEVTFVEPCGASVYGVGASAANVLDLQSAGLAAVGEELVAVTTGTSAPTTTVLSLAAGDLPLLGGSVLVDPVAIVLQATHVPAAGSATWILKVPEVASLAGASVFLQSFAPDLAQTAGLALSNGLRVTLCQ